MDPRLPTAFIFLERLRPTLLVADVTALPAVKRIVVAQLTFYEQETRRLSVSVKKADSLSKGCERNACVVLCC